MFGPKRPVFLVPTSWRSLGVMLPIVDFCSDVPAAQGFLLDKGVYTILDALGASTTIPFGINRRGQIIGTYIEPEGPTAGGITHGFLFDDGVFTTIDFPGPSETELAASTIRARSRASTATPRESPAVFCWTRRATSPRSTPVTPGKQRSSTSTTAARSLAATRSEGRSPTFS